MTVELKLPNLGENVESADIVDVMVAPGDVITEDQPVLEVETDKAAVEVPSDVAGRVTEIRVERGQTLKVGDVILVVDESAAPAAEASTDTGTPAANAPAAAPASPPGDAAPPPSRAPDPSPGSTVSATPAAAPEKLPAAQPSGDRLPISAAPSVRQFAREIGVDIYQVPGTGPGGRISVEDIKAHARQRASDAPIAEAPRTTREDMSKIRKVTAAHMARCWATIPHVTIKATADVTDLEGIRQQYKKLAEEAGGRLTVTAIFVKFVAESLKKHPTLNASIDMEKQQIEYHHFSNIGVAVDTERGLVVPVLRDVEAKSILDIAMELTEISAKARSGKLVPDDMSGGTFTVTNLGSLGVEHFTPIVNHPEVAILGMGRAKQEAVLIDGKFQPRLKIPLSLSFDHRLVDGAEGARFLRTLVAASENPLTMFFESS